ncbi:MAG TPA: fumarylacetoacetate hydrolase family protein [Pseudolabrys sp.]|nr:fumarylacetoacetate hydrolase family protein [Pseudolabrys sp.]
MTNAWDDPRIAKGMPAQLASRRARIAAGEKPIGWKVGLGAPLAMKNLALAGPCVGFLMQTAEVPSGGRVSFKGWTKPVAECEIAVRMGRDLRGPSSAEAARDAVKEIFPAIELADFDPPPTKDSIDEVLTINIYQRHVIFGSATRAGASLDGIASRLIRRNAEAASTADPEALTGRLAEIVAHVAGTLSAYGEKLAAGDIVITGSITPPIMLEADETSLTHALDPIGEVSISFQW